MADSRDHAAYRDGVEQLVNGSPGTAITTLEGALPEDSRAEPRLALAKARLALGDASGAAAALSAILSGERQVGTILRAYVNLLSARAAAIEGRHREANEFASEAARLDPRLDGAATSLRRTVESARS